MQSFISELRRRNVLRVAAFYAAAGWLLVQVATQVFPFFDIANWVVRVVVVAIALGFPAALALAWFYELTPQGLKLESEITPAESITRQTGRKLDRWIIVVLGLAVVLLLADKLVLHQAQPVAPAAIAANVAGSDKSIAVLPFDNLSDDKANAYFAVGIQDEILTRLAGIGALKVISRTSTEKYASHPDNLRTVAAQLGVASILEGSVQKFGDTARINVQLIDAATDHHLWAHTYDRAMKDVLGVESEVSQDIAEALQAQLSPSESNALATLPTRNAAAYDWFLKAENKASLAGETEVEADYRAAEEDYGKAIALDPDFALAHARLAYCQISRHWFVWRLSTEEMTQVKAGIDRALLLAPDLPEAQVALGQYWYWGFRDYDRAEPAYQRALALAPSNFNALVGLAALQRRRGHWPQALEAFGKVAEIGPRDPSILASLGETYMVLRRYPEAEQWLSRSLAIDPNGAEAVDELLTIHLFAHNDVDGARQLVATLPPGRRVLYDYVGGEAMTLTGPWVYPDVYERRFDQALKDWDSAPATTARQRNEQLAARTVIMMMAGRQSEIRGDCSQLKATLAVQAAAEPDEPAILTGLSWADLCLGLGDEAVRAARHATELLPLEKDAYFGAYYLNGLAQVDAWAGRPDEALQLITRLLSIPAGDYMSVGRLRHDPLWDPLRKDARFQKLIAADEAATGPARP
jgi:TolB-like protein